MLAKLKLTFTEFRRRRVFRVAAAYIVAGWLLIQLGSATFEPIGLPDWSMRLLLVMLAGGFVLACVLAWAYDIGVHGLERTPPLAKEAGTAAPGASVAILPFADLSEAHDQGYFCDGLAEEILNVLASIRGLRVASRTSSFRFRDSDTDARDIGRVLNVAAIMEGSVRKAGDRVRVTAQLIDAGNGYHLWSENFDRKLADIFAIQEEIARSVAGALRISMKAIADLDICRCAPRDMRAYDFYLRGRQILNMQGSDEWTRAPGMFRRAIELDPGYAQAHAGLADSLAQLLIWRILKPEDVLDEALAAAKRALELAPGQAETHVAHANTLSLAGEDGAAVEAFERAIELNPELYEAHYYFARHSYAQGRFAEAVGEFETAHRTQPDEFQALALAVNAAAAIDDPRRAEALAPLALEAALAAIDLDPANARARYLAAGVQVRMGEQDAARRSLEEALRLQPTDFGVLYNAACNYAKMGDADRALDTLDRAVSNGFGSRQWIERDPDFEELRSLPRFQAILTRLDPSRSP
ncbi:MAG TPA: tetratricopeptide repeat protein [Rhodanobacteraceae bacterium]|nr:tetratricopeptide repeat protein [Rhodanobacteraceae bacterium]